MFSYPPFSQLFQQFFLHIPYFNPKVVFPFYFPYNVFVEETCPLPFNTLLCPHISCKLAGRSRRGSRLRLNVWQNTSLEFFCAFLHIRSGGLYYLVLSLLVILRLISRVSCCQHDSSIVECLNSF